jgi:hypothetical protein
VNERVTLGEGDSGPAEESRRFLFGQPELLGHAEGQWLPDGVVDALELELLVGEVGPVLLY